MDDLANCLVALTDCHRNPSDRTIWHAESELKAYVGHAGESLQARAQAVEALETAWRGVDPTNSSPLVADFIDKWRRKLAKTGEEA